QRVAESALGIILSRVSIQWVDGRGTLLGGGRADSWEDDSGNSTTAGALAGRGPQTTNLTLGSIDQVCPHPAKGYDVLAPYAYSDAPGLPGTAWIGSVGPVWPGPLGDEIGNSRSALRDPEHLVYPAITSTNGSLLNVPVGHLIQDVGGQWGLSDTD